MKKFAISLIVLLLVVFVSFEISRKSDKFVLKIVRPNVLQIDLNDNKIVDDNETICVANLETFTSNLLISQETLAKEYNLTMPDAIALGYITDFQAEKLLANQNVELFFTDKISPECRYAEVYVNKENYAQKMFNDGYGIVAGEVSENFAKNLTRAQKMSLYILNHKSNKYHTIDCPYGLVAHDTVVVNKRELPKDAQACKFCHLDKQKVANEKVVNSIVPPVVITSGSIKFLLTDLTTKLKPDGDCTSQVCQTVLKEINSAKNSIDMAIYGWDKVAALETAFKNAVRRGVKLRIVYDQTTQNSHYYPDTKNLIDIAVASRGDLNTDNRVTNYLMHNKFIVIDNQKVLTGSMNYSKTGLSGFNGNNLALINSVDIAKLYTEEFEQMLNGRFHKSKVKSILPRNYKIGTSHVEVYFSPQDKVITNHIIKLVDNAKKYVYLPVFVITHEGLTNSLISAKNRGVDVKLIVDATNTSSKRSAVKFLRDNNVSVKVENYAGKMHNKSIIIDDKYIVTGSMNFSNSGENKNDENILILDDERLAIFYRNYFTYIWDKIPTKYLKHNVRSEGWNSIGSCDDGIDNNFDGKVDKDDYGCQPRKK